MLILKMGYTTYINMPSDNKNDLIEEFTLQFCFYN